MNNTTKWIFNLFQSLFYIFVITFPPYVRTQIREESRSRVDRVMPSTWSRRTIWNEGSGKSFSIKISPLLPDKVSCSGGGGEDRQQGMGKRYIGVNF